MKRIVTILLACALLTVSFGTVTALADEPTDIGQNLIVHYDFEGENPEEQLADKATAGTTTENLTIFTTQEAEQNLTYIEDGKAYINMAGGNYLMSEFTEDNGMGADLQGLTTFTVFLQFSGNGTGTQWADVLHVDHLARVFLANQKDANLTFDVRNRIGESCNSSNRLDTGAIGQSFFMEDGSGEGDVVCYAMTVEFDADAKTVKAKVYSSYDNGKTYELKEKSWENIESLYSTPSGRLVLGKLYDAKEANRGYSYIVDDLRIYNTALTEAQIQSITGVTADDESSQNPDDGGTTNKPEESQTNTPSETNAPAQTNEPQTTDAPVTTTAADNSDTAEKSGCGSAIGGIGICILMGTLSMAGLMIKKKEE